MLAKFVFLKRDPKWKFLTQIGVVMRCYGDF